MNIMIDDDILKKVISHLRNATLMIKSGMQDSALIPIKIADNIICYKLFGEILYPEYSKE